MTLPTMLNAAMFEGLMVPWDLAVAGSKVEEASHVRG